jgi:hypothetical protein
MSEGVIGALLVSLGLDTAAFEEGMKKAAVQSKGFASMVGGIGSAALTGAAIAAGVAGSAMLKFGFDSLSAAEELKRFGQLSNTSSVDFQKMSAGARTVGISQEKLADILKDVNDRVGDFLTTGGGPMKDFFEKVGPKIGVTAAQFKNLSGKDALQLYVSSLQKAGLNQQEMTFYMEAMASDATALIPLLAAGGAKMNALGEAAEKNGEIMSEKLTQRLVDAKLQMDNAKIGLSQMATVFAGEGIVAIMDLAEQLRPAIAEGQKLVSWAVDYMSPAVKELGAAFTNFAEGPTGKFLLEALKAIGLVIGGVVLVAFRTMIGTITNVLNALDQAGKNISGFIEGVKSSFANLTKILLAVLNPVQTVQKAFFTLYDKVVGHSYVPDMVDGIAAEFARLPKVMTNIALDEVAKVNDAFSGIGLKTLYKESQSQSLPDMPDQELKDMGTGMTEAIANSAETLRRTFAETFSDGLRAALSGDFGDWFEDWWMTKLNRAMTEAFDKLGGIIFDKIGGGQGGVLGGVLGGIFGESPKFATGGTVGFKGGGGTDSRLFSAWVSPSEIVRIGNADSMFGKADPAPQSVRVYVDQDGNWQAAVERIAGGVTGRALSGAAKAHTRQKAYGF